jgi:type I restriction enzyme S subunit
MELIKLKDTVDILTGCAFKGDKYSDKGIRVVRGENVTEGKLRWDTIKCWNIPFDKEEFYGLKADDIVIGMDGSKVGKNKARIFIKDWPLLLAQRVACLRSKENVDQVYLYYCINNPRFEDYVYRIQTGSSVPHISKTQIEEFQIPFPILSTQKQIAKVLSDLDAKIEINNKINQELEAMAKTLYDYWFVQFDFPFDFALGKPDKNGKPYKSSGGKMVFNEELKREIPEGWEDGTFETISTITGGSTPSKAVIENFTKENNISWITPKDLSQNKGKKFITRGEWDVSDLGIKNASLKIMPKGTVLLSSRAPIGYLAISRQEVTTNQGFKSFVSKENYSSEFIYYSVKNQIPKIEAYSSGSTFKEVSSSTLKTIKISIPNQGVLKEYYTISKPIFKKQNLLELENQKLSELRDWLLPMLMNGQLRITHPDAAQDLGEAEKELANVIGENAK